MVADAFVKKHALPELEANKMLKALATEGKIEGKHALTGKVKKEKVIVIEPETFMNKSGESVMKLVKTKKAAQTLMVIHDDLDLPLGRLKVSYNKSSGGHRGVESVIKAVKTQEFIRLRIGITPATAGGKLKKPDSEDLINDFIVADFKKPEADLLKKVVKTAVDALDTIILSGKDVAMGSFNSL
jgi:PTH1 family peptidyl-tRNA hydrolase